MKWSHGFVLLLAAGCAPGTAGIEPTVPVSTRISSDEGAIADVVLYESPSVDVRTVPATPDRAWALLPAVYDSIGVQVTAADPQARTLGNPNLRLRRQLRGVLLHEYLECGRTLGDYGADSYEVHASLLTRLAPADGGTTRVVTRLEARARPSGVASNWVQCSTTGRLERRIAAELERRLGR